LSWVIILHADPLKLVLGCAANHRLRFKN
jgi:hypothetical protein